MDWHWQLPLARYGEAWRQGRKLLDRALRPGAAATYQHMQQAKVRVLLTRLLATPSEWKLMLSCARPSFLYRDMFTHCTSLQFPRRNYIGYDVWI